MLKGNPLFSSKEMCGLQLRFSCSFEMKVIIEDVFSCLFFILKTDIFIQSSLQSLFQNCL